MTSPDPDSPRAKQLAETWLERALFASRWLLAPFYVGLALALGVLAVSFVQEFLHAAPTVFAPGSKPEDAILVVLSLVDMSLAGNLLLIVIFSGYESFVSRIDSVDAADRPAWMGKVDFAGLKIKLIASIVAISAISLLKSYMTLADGGALDERRLMWQVAILLAFVVSGVLLALMDWLVSLGGKGGKGH